MSEQVDIRPDMAAALTEVLNVCGENSNRTRPAENEWDAGYLQALAEVESAITSRLGGDRG